MGLSLRGIVSRLRGRRLDGHAVDADPVAPVAKKRRAKGVASAAPLEARLGDGIAPPEGSGARTYAREAGALVLIAAGIYAALALASFRADPLRPEIHGADWVGPAGSFVAGGLVELVGAAAWLVPLELALLARPLLGDRPLRWSLARPGGDILIAFVSAALVHVAFPRGTAFGAMPVAGVVGGAFGELLRGLFSTVGSYLVGLTVVGLILVQRAAFSVVASVRRLHALLLASQRGARRGMTLVGSAWTKARAIDIAERAADEPLIATPDQADAIIAAFADDGERFEPRRRAAVSLDPPTPSVTLVPAVDAPTPSPPQTDVETPTPAATRLDAPDAGTAPLLAAQTPAAPASTDGVPGSSDDVSCVASVADEVPEVRDRAPGESEDDPVGPKRGRRRAPGGPRIVDTSAALKSEKADVPARTAKASGFRLPDPGVLEPPTDQNVVVSHEKLRETAQLLEKTLLDYGVTGKVEEICPGPTLTTFEVSPAAGTKVSKIASLADDLALGLSRKVRIIAPIPGKNRVGFEVPNDRRVAVNLRELVEDRRFVEMDVPLPCVLGRDIIGKPFFADLASMPHVIVAGATGAGKSVGLNVMLVSLLFRRTPEELRMLLIDPKVVELAPFDRIPHLLLPVVTDMKQAANALKWAVDEMERRYQLFASAGTRNIQSYNEWCARVARGDAKRPRGPSKVGAVAPDGTEVEVAAAQDGSDYVPPARLPFIVIVVEEFADLMMQQGKDVEASVARLAQKARAAGMHVIVATQRPSVDVITGMIKANFPTRIAFRVAQKVDSRTILDEQGAEHLLGRGDMLVKMNGTNELRRVQCPFCSEEEVQRVTDMLRAQGEPEYDETIVMPRDEDAEGGSLEDAELDPLYDQAVRIVAETRRCSTSWIQRKLGVGYNRAAKMVEAMEKNGVIGVANGSKEREIFVSPA